jgi:hypothetical protein
MDHSENEPKPLQKFAAKYHWVITAALLLVIGPGAFMLGGGKLRHISEAGRELLHGVAELAEKFESKPFECRGTSNSPGAVCGNNNHVTNNFYGNDLTPKAAPERQAPESNVARNDQPDLSIPFNDKWPQLADSQSLPYWADPTEAILRTAPDNSLKTKAKRILVAQAKSIARWIPVEVIDQGDDGEGFHPRIVLRKCTNNFMPQQCYMPPNFGGRIPFKSYWAIPPR